MIAYYVGWRTPFIVFAVITAVFIVLAFKLREPVRGHFERKAMGASDEVADTEEDAALVGRVVAHRVAGPQPAAHLLRACRSSPSPSWACWCSSGLYYEEIFDLDERARGLLAAGLEGAAQLAGLLIGIPLATRLMAKGPGHVLRFLAQVSVGIAVAWAVFAAGPQPAWRSSPTSWCRSASSC